MPLDYEQAKKFFNDKLTNDLIGQGRLESAMYHTAMWIYDQGCKDIDIRLASAIDAMRVAGGSVEFQAAFDHAKNLIKKD